MHGGKEWIFWYNSLAFTKQCSSYVQDKANDETAAAIPLGQTGTLAAQSIFHGDLVAALAQLDAAEHEWEVNNA